MDRDGRTMRERMVAGELYLADDPELQAEQARAAHLCHAFNTEPDPARRQELLGRLLGAYGEGALLLPPLRCDYGAQLRIGPRSFVNGGLVALDVAPITIGADVQVGPNVQLLTATHPLDPDLRREKWEAARPILIEDNAWLGGGVIVCPGVTIGRDTVVGAGAVVTRDLPAGVLAVGNPARVVRPLR